WMVGSVISPDGVYEIDHVVDQVHAIYELDTSAFPEKDDVTQHAEDSQDVVAADASVTTTDDGSVIDMLVVYTGAARDDGNPDTSVQDERLDMAALIDTAINQTNDSFTKSHVDTRVRLAGIAEVPYIESGNALTDVTALRNGTNGLNVVHDLRQ